MESDDSSWDADVVETYSCGSDEYDDYDDDDDVPIYVFRPVVTVTQQDEMSVELDTKKQPVEMGVVRSLLHQAADMISSTFPYEAVELWAQRIGKGMPDEVQLALMKASFRVDKDLIRHYAYLSRKTDDYDPFSDLRPGRGQTAYQTEEMVVKDPLQIGFTLTGKVVNNRDYGDSKDAETMVAVTVDRRRITSTLCSAHSDSSWCRHVVKLVFYRIDYPHKVQYRLPVSDSVQRLSESEVKEFVSLLISRRPLDMLPLAQEMLDDLLERKQGSRKIGIGSMPVLEVPDLTAGGGMDDEGLWRVEEKEVRRVVRDYCQSNARLYRCVKMDDYGYGEASASSWLTALQRLSHENEGMTSTDARQVFSFGRGPTHFDLASRRELREILSVISALIEKGEQSAIAALCTVTELWLEFLTNEAQTKDKSRQASNVVDSSGVPSAENTEPRIQKLANQCVYPKNTDLMCKNSTWFLPDYITLCWRKVVFGSNLGSDDLKSIESALTTWGNQLKEVVSAGLRKTEQYMYDELHNSSHHRRRRFQRPDASLWRSLSGWNGFKHAAALLDPTVRFAYNLLTSTTVASTATPVLTESFRRAEILNTVAYFVVCLRDKGMEDAAKRLARQCITAVLSVSLAEPSSAKPHVEEGTTVPNSTNGLSVVAECHEKIVPSLWGDQSRKGVGMALVVLFQAIEEEDWAWSTKHTYNLKPWLIPLAGETLLHGLRQNSEEQAKLVVSPAVFLALLCILTCQHAASSSTLEQVELGSEKNRIISVMFEKIDEHECDDLQQQITKLSPVLKQKMSFLDCPAVALLLLQTAVSYNPDGNDYVQAVLPTVVAALRHQAKTQADVIAGLCPADFYCYQTQCAASSLVALHVYGGQEKEADIIIHSLTDTLLEILHTQDKMVKSDEWSKIKTADDSSKVKEQTHNLDNRKLVDYLRDMSSISESIGVEDDSRYGPYITPSALEERLAFMKSSAAQLCVSNSRIRKKEQQMPPSTSCLKSRLKEKDSSAKCNTALELLLILLQIESATDGRTECRDLLIQFLKNAVRQVGAVAFIRRLNGKGWDTVLTVEELSSFLTQDTFQRSFKGSCHQKDFPAAIEAVQQMFMSCAAALPSSCCTDLYTAARDLAVTDFLVRAVLSNNCDLKQTVSHALLFCLAHYGRGSVSLAERFQVGIEAVRRWQQHCSDNIQSRASLVASLDRSYGFSDDLKALLGLCRLVALAVFVDRQPSMSQRTAKRVSLGAVENLVLVFSEDWIDPLCAFIVLLEVSRLSHAQWETVTSIVQESHPETWDFSSLKQVLGSQQEFLQSPKSAIFLRQVCDTFECVLELTKKCKTRLAGFITRCKHVACTASVDQGANSGDEELPSRELCLRDFISLEHMCQAFPDDGYDFESLLHCPNKESSPTRHSYGYYRVVNEFTTFRRRRNGEPEDDQNDRKERGADLLQFLTLQHMMQEQARQAYFGFPFFFGADDPDDYY